jgi:uncharacterized surface protein with fasciclin (FAS1) repeats
LDLLWLRKETVMTRLSKQGRGHRPRTLTGNLTGMIAVVALALAPVACGEDDDAAAPVTPSRTGGSTGTGAGGTGGSAPAPVDILATAQAAGTFNTLVAAVTAAGLADTLKSPGPFTVFAPTDAAFAKLPAGTVDMLLKPENQAMLQSVLKYHVLAGRVPAAEVVTLTSATTVEGGKVTIAVSGGKVKVNDANVVATDIAASNGLIHVIDAVLIPQ